MIRYKTTVWTDHRIFPEVTKISIMRMDNTGKIGIVYEGSVYEFLHGSLAAILNAEANDHEFEYISMKEVNDE